mmetsp:Transcript_42655/g.101296  ORF Transcript_42655/g.101296 Transcript_42655/m.101296 type:complete len:248 (-) Transcript_42655:1129-1872(-)
MRRRWKRTWWGFPRASEASFETCRPSPAPFTTSSTRCIKKKRTQETSLKAKTSPTRMLKAVMTRAKIANWRTRRTAHDWCARSWTCSAGTSTRLQWSMAKSASARWTSTLAEPSRRTERCWWSICWRARPSRTSTPGRSWWCKDARCCAYSATSGTGQPLRSSRPSGSCGESRHSSSSLSPTERRATEWSILLSSWRSLRSMARRCSSCRSRSSRSSRRTTPSWRSLCSRTCANGSGCLKALSRPSL